LIVERRFRIYLFWAALFFLILAASACAARRPPFRPDISVPPLETPENVLSLLTRNYGGLESIKASGTLEFRPTGERRWKGASVILLAQRPDNVRLRAYRLLAPTLFEFVSGENRCWLFLPAEQAAYLDDDCRMIEAGEDNLVLSAETIVAALLVVSDFDSLRISPELGLEPNNILRVLLINETQLRRQLWIDTITGLATKQVFLTDDGEVEVEVDYLEHIAKRENVAPAEVEVHIPKAHAEMRLRLDDVELQPSLQPATFQFVPPPNVRIIKLNQSQQ